MTILFHNTTFDKIDVWKKTIKKYFKNEKIISLKDYKNFHDVNCAIIWNLPDNILSRLKNLQVIFSMGAGVDHILKLKNYNKKIPIIRIKDEEMGERIANYSLALYQIGQTQKAVQTMKSLVRKYPNLADMRAALTACLWEQNKKGEAESDWVAAVGVDPRYQDLDWVTNVRRWPPKLINSLEKFIKIE